MDTRTKILTIPQAIETARRLRVCGLRLRVATGHFDPLLAEHARRLEAQTKEGVELLVLVTEPDQPMLPVAARLELVASLRCTAYTAAMPQDQSESVLAKLEPESVCHFEKQDLASRSALVHRIQERTAKA